MTVEDEFTDKLADKISDKLKPHHVGRKQSLIYDLSFNEFGVVTMGVDPDTGEPLRGRGQGFEQDLLIYDKSHGHGHTSVIPRIVIEVKFGSVTTHDVIVYSEKADRIRRVYPYVRYGFLLGGMAKIPGRVLRLGQRFDFITTLSSALLDDELAKFCTLLKEEADSSLTLSNYLFNKRMKPNLFRKALVIS